MNFLWDAKKAANNRVKHGVGFDEAPRVRSQAVFLDTLSMTGADPEHSQGEARWLTFGVSSSGRFLVVSHTDEGEAIRLISARPGTRNERKFYEEA